MKSLSRNVGRAGIGHVRYPTAGTPSAQEAQPFFVNSPLGIFLIHNGNITNAAALREGLNSSDSFFNRHLRTDSDSEVSAWGPSAADGPLCLWMLRARLLQLRRRRRAALRKHPAWQSRQPQAKLRSCQQLVLGAGAAECAGGRHPPGAPAVSVGGVLRPQPGQRLKCMEV